MGIPYNYGPVVFNADSGDAVHELRVPHRATIRAIIFRQQNGAADGTIELFSSRDAAFATLDSGESLSSSLSSAAGASIDPQAYSVTAGELVVQDGVFQSADLSIPYVNSDGTPSNGVRRLWLRTRFAAAHQFSLTMMLETPRM